MKRPLIASLLLTLSLLALTACDRHDDHAQQSAAPAPAPAPVIINNQPSPPPPTVIVDEPAPPPQVEVVPDSPGPDFVWVPGIWFRDDHHHWAWRRGVWNHREGPGVHVDVDIHAHDEHH